jgi:hypothetical protein
VKCENKLGATKKTRSNKIDAIGIIGWKGGMSHNGPYKSSWYQNLVVIFIDALMSIKL